MILQTLVGNECEEKLDDCHMDAECVDLNQGYECICKIGYYGNGKHCYGK